MDNFKLIPPNKYQGKQLILSSDRLILNSKKDAILLFSSKAIGLSSGGTLNFDADKAFIVNAPRINLGINAKENVLLGNKTAEWLTELLNALQFLATNLKEDTLYVGQEQYPNMKSSIPSQNLNEVITELLRRIDDIKSKTTFTT